MVTATPSIPLQCRLAALSLPNSETRHPTDPSCASLMEPACTQIVQEEALTLILDIKHLNYLTTSISEKQYSKCNFKN